MNMEDINTKPLFSWEELDKLVNQDGQYEFDFTETDKLNEVWQNILHKSEEDAKEEFASGKSWSSVNKTPREIEKKLKEPVETAKSNHAQHYALALSRIKKYIGNEFIKFPSNCKANILFRVKLYDLYKLVEQYQIVHSKSFQDPAYTKSLMESIGKFGKMDYSKTVEE